MNRRPPDPPSGSPGFSRGPHPCSFPVGLLITEEDGSCHRRPSGRRNTVVSLTARRKGAWRYRTAAIVFSATALLLTCSVSAHAQAAQPWLPNAPSAAVDRWSSLLAEAALRTDLPSAWLHELVRVESGGDERAVSSKGALGLMQLMPPTYSMLRAMLALGADPLSPRDNILAGATYLRLLVDRYGWPGALAAYNAGPARLDAFLMDRRPLPAETVAYLWRFDGRVASAAPSGRPNAVQTGFESATPTSMVPSVSRAPPPSRSSLFVSKAVPQTARPIGASVAVAGSRRIAATTTGWRRSGLFAPMAANPGDR